MTTPAAASTCESPSRELLPIATAIARLLQSAAPVEGTQEVPLIEAAGRVLAASLHSPIDLPPWPNSSVDGYALRFADIATQPNAKLQVSQRIPAGTMGPPLAAGTAARIFTGAPLPQGADTVVMQEDCTERDGFVMLNGSASLGDGVRDQGEDVRAGTEILSGGQLLRPQDVGLAAAVGLATLPVKPRLRVALLATGDELVAPGQPLQPGQIYNANLYLLWSSLQHQGCEVISFGSVRDDLHQTMCALEQAAAKSDLIISSGGVSVGEEDHVRTALCELGHLDFWRIAVKPGKPLAFGKVANTPFLGLPGNPVSAWITYCLFAIPFIRARQGTRFIPPKSTRIIAEFSRNNRGVREEYVRARLVHQQADGRVRAEIHPNQSSGAFSSVAWSEGLVKIEADRQVKPGDHVEYFPYSEFGV